MRAHVAGSASQHDEGTTQRDEQLERAIIEEAQWVFGHIKCLEQALDKAHSRVVAVEAVQVIQESVINDLRSQIGVLQEQLQSERTTRPSSLDDYVPAREVRRLQAQVRHLELLLATREFSTK